MKSLKHILILGILLSFTSCMVIGSAIGGKKTTFEKNYTLKTNLDLDGNKNKLKTILYSEGWNKVSEKESTLIFTNENSILKEIAFSKKDVKKIISKVKDNLIEFEIIQHGNFKTGTEGKANKTFELIKREFAN